MWIDTNGCEESFHKIVKEEGQWFCVHSNNDPCPDAEFNVSDLAEAA